MGSFSKYNIWIVTEEEWKADGTYQDPSSIHFYQRWRASVEKALSMIEGTQAGIALFSRIRLGPAITIRPHPIRVFGDPNAACKAHGGPVREVLSAERVRARMRKDGFNSDQTVNLKPITIGAVVAIEPENLEKGNNCYKNIRKLSAGHDFGSAPDEVLYHELVHAQRGAARIHDPSGLGSALSRYTNMEEFLAVVLANVYISNKGSGGLRAGHNGHELLEKNLAGSVSFYTSSPEVLHIITRFSKDDPSFYRFISDVITGFNPFWAHRHKRAEIEKLSLSLSAKNALAAGKAIADGFSAVAKKVLGR
jgi:hypothetical protein